MQNETNRRRTSSKSSIEIRSGSEGPRHDPYSYEEVTVRRQDGRVIRAHLGLAEWMECKLPGERGVIHNDMNYDLFERLAGISVMTAVKTMQRKLPEARARNHARQCNGEFECVNGYPGESFTICQKCGFHLDYSFNHSAIV